MRRKGYLKYVENIAIEDIVSVEEVMTLQMVHTTLDLLPLVTITKYLCSIPTQIVRLINQYFLYVPRHVESQKLNPLFIIGICRDDFSENIKIIYSEDKKGTSLCSVVHRGYQYDRDASKLLKEINEHRIKFKKFIDKIREEEKNDYLS